MTNKEREKLIEDMLKAYFRNMFDNSGMSAALAIAERRIREDRAGKAKIAWLEADVGILGDADYASALCEWTSDTILASIPEPPK